MCKKNSEEEKFTMPEWDYKDSLYLEPCEHYDPEDGAYDLYVRGILTDIDEYEDSEEFFKIAQLDVCNLYDLYWNICEKLDVEHAREDLKKQFKKEKN